MVFKERWDYSVKTVVIEDGLESENIKFGRSSGLPADVELRCRSRGRDPEGISSSRRPWRAGPPSVTSQRRNARNAVLLGEVLLV